MSNENFALIKNKKIIQVEINKAKDALRFDCADGSKFSMYVEADCCSSSWIENIDGVDRLMNAEIVEIDGVKMDEISEYYRGDSEYRREDDHHEHDVLKFYSMKIKTTKGMCEIEYRNSSNGYYGASVSLMPTKESSAYDWKGDDDFHILAKDF